MKLAWIVVFVVASGCSRSKNARCRAAVEKVTQLTHQTSKSQIEGAVRDCVEGHNWPDESLDCFAAANSIEQLVACDKQPKPPRPVDEEANVMTATQIVKRLALEDYPRWAAEHPDKQCPDSIEELLKLTALPIKQDPWGNLYLMTCESRGVAVRSTGPDGKLDTSDDIVAK